MDKNGIDCSGFALLLLEKNIYGFNLATTIKRPSRNHYRRRSQHNLEEGDLNLFFFRGQ
jgi:hypothetical protein